VTASRQRHYADPESVYKDATKILERVRAAIQADRLTGLEALDNIAQFWQDAKAFYEPLKHEVG
jgi:hypothetical protein